MHITRQVALERLVELSDAEHPEMTTSGAVAAGLGADAVTVKTRIEELVACELAHVGADGEVRATVTGEELPALNTAELVIVDPVGGETEGSQG